MPYTSNFLGTSPIYYPGIVRRWKDSARSESHDRYRDAKESGNKDNGIAATETQLGHDDPDILKGALLFDNLHPHPLMCDTRL